MEVVKRDQELTCIPLSFADRTGHLPHLLAELIYRLRLPPPASKANISIPARQHGNLRRKQRYVPAMVVEDRESCRSVSLKPFKTPGGEWISQRCCSIRRRSLSELASISFSAPILPRSAACWCPQRRARRVGLLGVGHEKTPNSSTSGLKRACVRTGARIRQNRCNIFNNYVFEVPECQHLPIYRHPVRF